jgi:hypothetical protein
MRWVLAAACAAAVSFALAPAADAKGCIKGAIVGGVAGHHEANKADKANPQAPSGQK